MRSTRLLATRVLVIACAQVGLWTSPAAATPGDSAGMLAHVNEARATDLVVDARLVEMAQRQAHRMLSAGRIFHNPHLGDELRNHTNDWSIVGENVGEGLDLGKIEDAFMDSPTHRRNILDAGYNAIGIGVLERGDGRLFVAQVFARFERPPARAVPVAPVARFAPVAYFPTACAGARGDGVIEFYGC